MNVCFMQQPSHRTRYFTKSCPSATSTENGCAGPDQRLSLLSILFPTVAIKGCPKEENKNRISTYNTPVSIYMPTSFPLASTTSHSQLTELLTGFLPVQWESIDLFSINLPSFTQVMSTFKIHSFSDNTQLHWPTLSKRTIYFWSPSAGLLPTSFGIPKSLCHKAMNNSHLPDVLPQFTNLCHISFPYPPSGGVVVHSVLPHTEALWPLWTALHLFSEPSVSARLWRGNDESSIMAMKQVNQEFLFHLSNVPCSILRALPYL